jgi:hypothetical protein
MRARYLLMSSLAALCLLSLAPAHAAGSRTVHEDYVGNFDPLTFGRCHDSRVPENVGKVCIPVKSTDIRVTVTLVDQVLPTPAFFYEFFDSSGDCVGDPGGATDVCPNAGGGCGTRSSIAVPRGAVRLEVYTDGVVLGTLKCSEDPNAEGPGAAIAGTVTAKFVTA